MLGNLLLGDSLRGCAATGPIAGIALYDVLQVLREDATRARGSDYRVDLGAFLGHLEDGVLLRGDVVVVGLLGWLAFDGLVAIVELRPAAILLFPADPAAAEFLIALD